MGAIGRACLLALLLACAWSARAGLRIEVDTTGLTPVEAAASRALAERAQALLPAGFLQGFDASRATFIQKPFTGAALLQRIREVLELAA